MNEVTNKANPWFAISMGLAGIIVGVVVGYSVGVGTGPQVPAQVADQPSGQVPSPDVEITPVDAKKDHIRGEKNAQITIFEYSDFECPFCSRHAPTIEKILVEYSGDVNVVFRHFPLSFHPNAQKAAEASECAADQGGNDAFWAFHDKLFEDGAEQENYEGYAQEIGLNFSDFNDCLESGKFEQKVKDDMNTGVKAGIRGTPGNILFDNKTEEFKTISGAQPFENFKAVLDEML